MSDEETEDDFFDQIIERNRYQIVKYIDPKDFYAYLREKSVFTSDDQDDLEGRYHARRQKAGAFLDVLHKKGTLGVDMFLECLEFEYPELYKVVTGKESRPPPPAFKRRSNCGSFRFPSHLNDLVKDMREKHKNNQDLVRKLETMDSVLKYEQKENKELEKETEELRKKVTELEKISKDLESQITNLKAEKSSLKDDSLTHLKSCVDYAKQCELYRDRWQRVQSEKDELERTLYKLKDSQHEEIPVRIPSTKKRDLGGATGRDVIRTPSEIHNQRSEEEKQILKDRLEETQEELDALSQDLDRTRYQLDDYQSRYNTAQKDLNKLRAERDQLDGLHKQHTKRNDEYFEIITQLQNQKNQFEEERINDQRKASEESKKYTSLFGEYHKLEKKHIELQNEYEKLRSKRDSQESKASTRDSEYCLQIISLSSSEDPEPPCLLRIGRTDTVTPRYGSVPHIIEGETHPLYDNLDSTGNAESLSGGSIPEESRYEVLDVMIPKLTEKRSSGEPTTITVKLSISVVEKMELIGGNIVGIYIDKFVKKTDTAIEVGDKVISIGEFTNGVSPEDAKHTQLANRTLEEVRTIVHSCIDSKPKQLGKMIEIKVERNPKAYNEAVLWMTDHKDSGDFFYVKCQYELNEEQECATIDKNDVYCVTSTTSNPRFWKALKFNKETNVFSTDPVSIPNHSTCFSLTRRNNPRNLITAHKQHRRPFRHRPYYRVLPVKVCVDMVVNHVANPDDSDERPPHPLPMKTQYQEKIQWRTEKQLKKHEVEKYRVLLDRPYYRVLSVKVCVDMVVNHVANPDDSDERPPHPFPMKTQYQEKIQWRTEKQLKKHVVEKYRVLLGFSYGSFCSQDDTNDTYQRSQSVPH